LAKISLGWVEKKREDVAQDKWVSNHRYIDLCLGHWRLGLSLLLFPHFPPLLLAKSAIYLGQTKAKDNPANIRWPTDKRSTFAK